MGEKKKNRPPEPSVKMTPKCDDQSRLNLDSEGLLIANHISAGDD